MASSVPLNKMKRSKSLNYLAESDCRWKSECDKMNVGDESGVQHDDAYFARLERKITEVTDACIGLNREVTEMTAVVQGLPEWWRGAAGTVDDKLAALAARLRLRDHVEDREKSAESGARSLLDSVLARPSLVRSVEDAVSGLLQNEEFIKSIVSATKAALKEPYSMLNAELMPFMNRANKLLLEHVTKMVAAAFADLEEKNARNFDDISRQSSQSLQADLHRHEGLLLQASKGSYMHADDIASTVAKVVEDEMKRLRKQFSNAMLTVSECNSAHEDSASTTSCASSEALGYTQLSPIDRMMITAEVMWLFKEGDANGAFNRALEARDLSVVAAACHAAAPAPALTQPVLMSLLQQLSTDLLIDSTLQCCYIEYALENLNLADAATRAHLPLVVGEVEQHLSAFLRKYPHHIYANRISAIIDIALKLLNYVKCLLNFPTT